MEAIIECCCGVDVHKEMIEACIIKGVDNPIFIREKFSTFQKIRGRFCDWIVFSINQPLIFLLN